MAKLSQKLLIKNIKKPLIHIYTHIIIIDIIKKIKNIYLEAKK